MQSLKWLRKELNKMCSILDEQYDLNSGGCCYVAYIIAEFLDKFHIPYHLAVYSSTEKIKQSLLYELNNHVSICEEEHSMTEHNCCSHYCIYISYCGEINTVKNDWWERYLLRNVKSSDDIRWIYEFSEWNDCYDTRNNDSVKKAIESIFKQYEKGN